MKVKLYIDTEQFNSKPNVEDIKKISSRMLKNKVTISIEDFAEEIACKGKTTVLANYLNGVKLTSRSKMYGQQVLMLDFDSKGKYFSIEDLLSDDFIQENASFYYETFNSTATKNRFRVVFVLDNPIIKYEDVEKTYQELFERYPMSDTTVGQTNRLFFGSTKGFNEINFNNRLSQSFYKEPKNEPIKQELLITDEMTPNYELFRQHMFDELSIRYGDDYKASFPDESVASSYFRTIDMREFLGLPDENPFHDIFHDEDNPSSSIFYKQDTDVYLYKCFSESNTRTMDMLKVISELTGLGFFTTIDILTKVTNSVIDVNSEVAKIKRKTNTFIDFINRVEFKETEPVLYSWIGRYVPEITTLLQVVSTYIWQDFNSGEIRLVSFLSTESMAREVSGRLGYTVTPTKMKNVINVLSTIDGIWKLEDKDVPKELLDTLNESKISKEHYRRSNVLELKEYSDDFISDMVNVADELKRNNVTVKGLSFELLYRLFDEDTANKVFPQTINKDSENKIAKKSSSLEKSIVKFIMKELDSNSYVYESDIIKYLNKRMSKSEATYKLQQMRTDICNKYDLYRKRLTRDLADNLGIKGKITSKIIYYNK